MARLSDRWDFLPRYRLGNALMRLSLVVMPASRVRDDIKAILAAYRAGCEAAVFLDAMRRLDFFTAEVESDDVVVVDPYGCGVPGRETLH